MRHSSIHSLTSIQIQIQIVFILCRQYLNRHEPGTPLSPFQTPPSHVWPSYGNGSHPLKKPNFFDQSHDSRVAALVECSTSCTCTAVCTAASLEISMYEVEGWVHEKAVYLAAITVPLINLYSFRTVLPGQGFYIPISLTLVPTNFVVL